MWTSKPACVPNEWRLSGAKALRDSINKAKATATAPAYVWFEEGTKQCLSFSDAHSNADKLSQLIRATAIATGVVAGVADNSSPLICGLVLKRSASLPLAQLATFNAGGTFVPCDPT